MFHVKQLDLKSVGIGCDWVTVTATGEPLCELLLGYAQMIEAELSEDRFMTVDWRGLGYRGFQAGPLRYGVRKDSQAIMMVSGEAAQRYVDVIGNTNLHVTRVDFQVTIELSPPDEKFVRRWYKLFDETKNVDPSTPYYKYIASPTGDTLYVNKRSGSTQLRMYDKSRDYNASQLGTFVRFEVEYKKQAAEFAYRRWMTRKQDKEWICEVVAAEFKRRGINICFDGILGGSAIEKGQMVTTVDGTLGWLSRCVSPVIMRLIDAGYGDEVYNVLRLKDLL
jgi:hypothetical protein